MSDPQANGTSGSPSRAGKPPRWLIWALFGVMTAAWLFVSTNLVREGLPSGTVEDLESLSSRDDLNVLFILVDTLRSDRLGVYGYERETSPRIDEMAADGIRFARHRSQSSWTKTSMASLWTSLYPARTQVLRYPHAMPDTAQMPAELFQAAGFRTFGVWRNGWVAPNFGFDQGFESYHNPRVSNPPAEVRQENPTLQINSTDNDIVDSTIALLRSFQSERWFLYLHMMDVHQYTYDEESALFGISYSDTYDNSIRRTDRLIGTILDELTALDLRKKTLVVLVSDHGEAFGEHGHEGHARDVHAEVTTTPFIIGLPFRLEDGIVVETEAENVDVWPTLLDMVGLPPLAESDGRSMVQEVLASARGEVLASDGEAGFAHLDRAWGKVSQEPNSVVAVAHDGYRLVQPLAPGEASSLYQIAEDPMEQVDLIEEEPERARILGERVEAYLEQSEPPWRPEEVEIDDMNLRQLRALGYVVE